MEIVIENPRSVSPTGPILPSLSSSREHPHRGTGFVTSELAPIGLNRDFYRTLPNLKLSRSRNLSPEPMYETKVPIQTSLRRVDRSGLLEIVDHEEPARNRLSRSAEPGLGSLSRRIDRSGLLEAVLELPDQGWKNGEEVQPMMQIGTEYSGSETIRRQNSILRRLQPSPRADSASQTLIVPEEKEIKDDKDEVKLSTDKSRGRTSPSSLATSSPYLRRYPVESGSSGLERPIPVLASEEAPRARNNSFTCLTPSEKFLPIESMTRSRQTYLDLTGYSANSRCAENFSEIDKNETGNDNQSLAKPDCLGRSSLRSKTERESPLTMSSSIPDVIEAHGSRSRSRDGSSMEHSPECKDRKNNEREVRAEAEGCEERAIDDRSEDPKIGFTGSKNLVHNDNIQTLRVIILSEQL